MGSAERGRSRGSCQRCQLQGMVREGTGWNLCPLRQALAPESFVSPEALEGPKGVLGQLVVGHGYMLWVALPQLGLI